MLSSQVVSTYRDNASPGSVLGVHHSAKYSTTGILDFNIRVIVLKNLGGQSDLEATQFVV